LSKLMITAGVLAVAVLAIAVTLTANRSNEARYEPEQQPTVTQGAAKQIPAAEPSMEAAVVAPAPQYEPQVKTRGLGTVLAKDKQGRVCETPSGTVCKVKADTINSRCECDGSVGRIVR